MENLHPEYTAISAIIVNIIMHLCKTHGFPIDADIQGELTIVTMYIVSRLAKRLDPPSNVQLVGQIQKNLSSQQDKQDNNVEETATAIAQALPASVVSSAAKQQGQ